MAVHPRSAADAHAQQTGAGTVYRLGLLSQGQPPKTYIDGLKQGLRDLGYAEGRNLVWEIRATDGSLERLPQLADELVRLKVDVILARASSGALAAKKATTTIPIVFLAVYAPVEVGLVPSLGRPGGNITGIAVNASDLAGKRVEVLKDLVPSLKRIVMLSHTPHPSNSVQLDGAKAAARALGLQLDVAPVRSADDFAPALKAHPGADGVLHADTPLFVTGRGRLVEAIAQSRRPAVYVARVYVEAGGLMSYGSDVAELWRRGAVYVDKILKGARPGDLPVEQPNAFELTINRRTARAMGVTIPQPLMLRANAIIE
jgi:putative tryptophan/tyrosine transport system substrate-binding protein